MFIFSDVYDLHCNYLCTYNVIASFVYMLTLEFMGNLQCKLLGKTSYIGGLHCNFLVFYTMDFSGMFSDVDLSILYMQETPSVFCSCKR